MGHIEQLELDTPLEFDALLVLGRGIDEYGRLSAASEQRAVAAARVSRLALPHTVVFSGGRSWRQVAAGILPPAEGEVMLKRALDELGGELPAGVDFLAENESVNTAENMVNSNPLLNLRKGDTLAIMSDERHFAFGRIHRLGSLIFPGFHKLAFRLPNPEPATDTEMKEEWLLSAVTRVGMAGVRPGDHHAVVRRHSWIKSLNEVRSKLPT